MKILGAIVVLLCSLYFGSIYFFDYSIESPAYEVVDQLSKNIDVRQYGEYYQAYVSYDEASENSAFSKLFNFISGSNTLEDSLDMTAPVKIPMTTPVKIPMTAPVKIPMTAPVKLPMTTPVKNLSFQGMAFVMPDDFNPQIKPLDPAVEIQKIEPKKYAVLRYSGLMRRALMQEKTSQLKVALDAKGYEYYPTAIFAAYNGPYTLPFLRRNEVWIELK